MPEHRRKDVTMEGSSKVTGIMSRIGKHIKGDTSSYNRVYEEFYKQELDADRLAARVAELEAENGKLTNSVHNLLVVKDAKEDLELALAAANTRVKELEADYRECEEENDHFTARIGELTASLAAANAEIEKLNSRLNQLAAQGMERMGFRPEGAPDATD